MGWPVNGQRRPLRGAGFGGTILAPHPVSRVHGDFDFSTYPVLGQHSEAKSLILLGLGGGIESFTGKRQLSVPALGFLSRRLAGAARVRGATGCRNECGCVGCRMVLVSPLGLSSCVLVNPDPVDRLFDK